MNPKSIRLSLHALLIAACVFMGVLPAPAQETDAKPMLRLICATVTAEAQQAVLASKKENGQWNRLAGTELRTPMVSDWLPSLHGEIHVLIQKNGKPESIGHFTHPADSRRLLVILADDEEAKGHRIIVVDPDKKGFTAGSTVIINASKIAGTVSLGAEPVAVEAGSQLVAKPVADGDGGYGVMVHYTDEQGAKQPCYDRRAILNPNTRNIILLLPDPSVTLKVISLSEFGPFE
jgi:hypothetical protein